MSSSSNTGSATPSIRLCPCNARKASGVYCTKLAAIRVVAGQGRVKGQEEELGQALSLHLIWIGIWVKYAAVHASPYDANRQLRAKGMS